MVEEIRILEERGDTMKKITQYTLIGGVCGLIWGILLLFLSFVIENFGLEFLFTIGLPFYLGGVIGSLVFGCQEMTCFPYFFILGIIFYVLIGVVIAYFIFKKRKIKHYRKWEKV